MTTTSVVVLSLQHITVEMLLNNKGRNVNRFLQLFCAILTLISQSCCIDRKLESQINPGCNEVPVCNGTEIPFTVVHVTATGPNDTIHYLWDFEGKPSILLALTSHSAVLNIDWENFLWGKEEAVTFSEEPLYTFGIIFNKIYEYDDVNNTGVLDFNSSLVMELDTKEFYWKRTAFVQDEKSIVLSMEGTNSSRSGSLKMMVNGFGFREHSKNLPHLLHSANSTLVEIEIDGLETEPTFRNSRFAVEFLLASEDPVKEAMMIDVRKSLDDEQTPGVFTLVDLLTPSSRSGVDGGYLQWRPVAYVSRVRSLANSTETNSYGVNAVANPSAAFKDTLLHSYYGDDLVNNILVQNAVVSFGLKDDGFYKKTNYTSWAFTMGYGLPPNEDFSLLVILVISIGLGLPAVLIAVSGIVFAVRRVTRKKDELCLSR